MTRRPMRSAAENANRHLRDSSTSPELSPPPPPKRARSSKQQPSAQNSRSNQALGSQSKRAAKNVAPEPILEEPNSEIIEILDSDEDGPEVGPEEKHVPELIEEEPSLSGEMIFVKIRVDGSMVEDSEEEGLWWPSGIVERNPDGTVDIFSLSSVSPGVSRRLIVPAAVRDNVVRTMRSGSGVLSTNVSSYRMDVNPDKLTKRTSERLDTEFRRGLKRMRAGDEDAEFPTISELLASNKAHTHDEEVSLVDYADTWTPPGPERNLEIPGELVLATQTSPKKIRSTTEYWAGRIDAYVTPSDRTIPPRYTVTFFENTVEDLQRSQFYTSAEEQFMTCKLGLVASNDTVNDIDDESCTSPDPDNGHFEPFLPPPPPTSFDDLPLRHQFAYTVPILRAIINHEYEPARNLHEEFKRGGAARMKLKRKAPSIGKLKETTVKKFWQLVDQWALGVESRIAVPGLSNSGMDDQPVPLLALREGSADTECISDLPPSSLPTTSKRMLSSMSSVHDEVDSVTSLSSRPRGCEYYESLTTDERREYCSLILHGEAILQLLLWREGERDVLELSSAEIEVDLREKAVALSRQGDIQTLVLELRKQRLGLASLQREPTLAGPKALTRTGSGTRSRPRQGSFRSS